MKFLLITVLVLFSYVALCQEKLLRKIEKEWSKERSEKVMRLSKKFNHQFKKRPEGYYYLAMVNLKQAQANNHKDAYVQGIITNFREAVKWDKYRSVCFEDQGLLEDISAVIESKAVGAKEKQALKSKNYTLFLAEVLKDTIPLYYDFFPKQEVVKDEVIERKTGRISKITRPEDFVKPEKMPFRDSIAFFAQKLVGIPYRWAGETPAGFDCSGFVLYVMRNFGFDFYHQTKAIAKLGTEVKLEESKPGDIAIFGYRDQSGKGRVSHVGLIVHSSVEEYRVIHSVSRGVCEDSLLNSHWQGQLLAVRRIIED